MENNSSAAWYDIIKAGKLTIEQAYELLENGHTFGVQQGVDMPISAWFKDEDLPLYNHIVGTWWPKDAPPRMDPPFFHHLAQTYWHPKDPRTFRQIIEAAANYCVLWLESEGRNVHNPNETKEEKARRLARERTARHRAIKKSEEEVATDSEKEKLFTEVTRLDALIKSTAEEMEDAMLPLRQAAAAAHELSVVKGRERKAAQEMWRAKINTLKDERAELLLGLKKLPDA